MKGLTIKELENSFYYPLIFLAFHIINISCAYQIIKMNFSKHFFITFRTIAVLVILVYPTMAFKKYMIEFFGMFLSLYI